MTTNKEFQIADQLGRDLFTAYCHNVIPGCKVTKYSKDDYAVWDVAYTIGTSKYIGEIKVREEYESDAFSNWYLEKKKSDNLNQIKKRIENKQIKQTKIHYINIFPKSNDEIRIYNITNIQNEQTSTIVKLPYTTKGLDIMVDKDVYYCNAHNETDITLKPRLNKLNLKVISSDEDEEEELPF